MLNSIFSDYSDIFGVTVMYGYLDDGAYVPQIVASAWCVNFLRTRLPFYVRQGYFDGLLELPATLVPDLLQLGTV
jgi:hypothetical protein